MKNKRKTTIDIKNRKNMQKDLLNSSSIRLQIAKGGTNDLQFHLNRYRVSVHYTTNKPYRLIAVVFRVAHSGMVPLARFVFPADESVLATDYKTFVRLIYETDKKGRNEVAIRRCSMPLPVRAKSSQHSLNC